MTDQMRGTGADSISPGNRTSCTDDETGGFGLQSTRPSGPL
jgi:hypothetical protein